ncbi:uncharacterized protein KY384_003723 [Bacidia gigantensis]|uniref:uncharacterized protein n=1 Tax=Bacidia gigantensis TaxID=2732470 RepID=UPI001D05BA54|nr:uncharacterized protein KY384_003723 [Bacidia gigantensis]KAG8532086.1 hypothetical protein KY384_003723 [Bacidia gigantensis]
MPKAEVGSTKYLSNKLKSKGLQRLRWWCEPCQKQCRDANGFKCHTQSEAHVRQMQAIGSNANQVISSYSADFQRNFLTQLRTAHGTKQVLMNRFYQEVIAEKEHVHMNSTRWSSLTEFAKHLGREGLVRVEENDKGLHITWIDNSPEALRRAEAIKKKERQDKGDEEREQRLIREQISRARLDAEARERDDELQEGELNRAQGEKITLNFGIKPLQQRDLVFPLTEQEVLAAEREHHNATPKSESPPTGVPTPPPEKVSLKLNATSKPKNVFAAVSKKKVLNNGKAAVKEAPKRPMSEAERIMKEEIEQKRKRESHGRPGLNTKRPKLF